MSWFGRPAEKPLRMVCPDCDPDAPAPFVVGRCYFHLELPPMSAHDAATRESMPSLDAIKGVA